MREGDVPSFDFETSKTPKMVISITLMGVCQRSIIVYEEWGKGNDFLSQIKPSKNSKDSDFHYFDKGLSKE